MDTAVNVAAADPGPTTGRPPYGPHAHGLGPIAARPALFSPAAMAAAPSPRTCTLGGPPVWRGTPGLAPPSPSLVHAVHNGIQAPAAAATVAQRALWPAADDRRMHLAPNIVQQAGAGADSTGAGPFRPELSRAGVASSGPVTGVGAGSGVLPQHREVSSAFDYFGGQLLPANMASSVKRRLHSVVARHHLYVSPHDFDSAILGRLANMPEPTAMNVLNQAESANWPEVKNNTRVIMSMCTKWANLRA